MSARFKKLKLIGGGVSYLDQEDFELFRFFKWRIDRDGYARTSVWVDGANETRLLHRVIMNATKGMEVDHINHRRADNRKINLRLVTKSQNQMNSKKKNGFSSKYKGVSFVKLYGKWQATITIDGKNKNIGSFISEKEAAKTYNNYARKHFGEFACLNKIK